MKALRFVLPAIAIIGGIGAGCLIWQAGQRRVIDKPRVESAVNGSLIRPFTCPGWAIHGCEPACPYDIRRIGYADERLVLGWEVSNRKALPAFQDSEYTIGDLARIYQHRREFNCPETSDAEIAEMKRDAEKESHGHSH